MSDALTKVLRERERIRQRIGRQRNEVAVAFDALARPAAIVDHAVRAIQVLRAHPAAIAAIVAGLFVLRARAVIGLLGRGIGVWRLLHGFRALIARIPF